MVFLSEGGKDFQEQKKSKNAIFYTMVVKFLRSHVGIIWQYPGRF